MIDLHKIKRLAEAASPGPWFSFVAPSEANPIWKGIANMMGEEFLDGEATSRANLRYIASVNPSVVLELIEELSVLRKCITLSDGDLRYRRWQNDKKRGIK